MARPVYRFAPSPNGALHLGHAYSVLLNDAMAKRSGGRMLLRIEDIDQSRSRPDFEDGILRDLAWLGLDWERPVRRQSDHLDTYADALAMLRCEGLVYPAFMTRGEVRATIAESEATSGPWPRDPDGAPFYPGRDRVLSEAERRRRIADGEVHAFRLDMARAIESIGTADLPFDEDGEGPRGEKGRIAADPSVWGDVVIARADVPTSYHLSVTLDDAIQGVTHVVRGRDLFHATSVHRLLQQLLRLPVPVYHHHRLVLDEEGRKLSKSLRSTAISSLRDAGATPADVRRIVGPAPAGFAFVGEHD